MKTAFDLAVAAIGLLTFSLLPTTEAQPTVSTDPHPQFAWEGKRVILSVAANGAASPSFHWQLNGTNITDATNRSLSIALVPLTRDGGYLNISEHGYREMNRSGGGILDDGTWHVSRRAFPFQPTMDSGLPHGRGGWISVMARSWAVMVLSWRNEPEAMTGASSAAVRLTDHS